MIWYTYVSIVYRELRDSKTKSNSKKEHFSLKKMTLVSFFILKK